MPNNKKKRVTRRQRITENTPSVESSTSDALLEKEFKKINIVEDNFKPGTVVQIKDLKKRPELNGQYSVIVEKQLENGRFPIMNPGQKSMLALNRDNFDTIHQCPAKDEQAESGMMIFPKIKSVNTPSILFLNDETLKKCFVNPFRFFVDFDDADNPPKFFSSDMLQKYFDRLKVLLKWKNPVFEMGTHSDEIGISNQFMVFHDLHSKADNNKWISSRHADIEWTKDVRGAIIYIEHLEEPESHHDSTIFHQTVFHNHHYFDLSLPDPSIKEQYKIGERNRKIMTQLARTGMCPTIKKCDRCERVQKGWLKEEIEVKRYSEERSIPKYQAWQDRLDGDTLRDILKEHEVDHKQWLMAFWKYNIDTEPEHRKLYNAYKNSVNPVDKETYEKIYNLYQESR